MTADTALALEVSSYQLETASAFRPTVGALLNVTPDHLSRHGTLDNYARTKFKLFQEQRGDETAVLNARDALCRALRGLAPAGVAWFGDRLPGPGLRWSASGLVGFGGRWALPAHLPGRHNGEYAAAADEDTRTTDQYPTATHRHTGATDTDADPACVWSAPCHATSS